MRYSHYLFVLFVFLFQSCVSNRGLIRIAHKSNVYHLSKIFYDIPKNDIDSIKERIPNKKDIKWIEKLLNRYVDIFRKENKKKLPKVNIRVLNNEKVNAYARCCINIDTCRKSINFDSGIFRKILQVSIKNAIERNNNPFGKDNKSIFSDAAWDTFTYLKFLHNIKPHTVNFIKYLKLMDDDEEEYIYPDHILDVPWINFSIDMEINKLITFILFHEYRHILNDCDSGIDAEFTADRTGVKLYSLLYSKIDKLTFFVPGVDMGVIGRDISLIVEDVYKNSVIKEDLSSHPPLEARLIKINEYLANKSQEIDMESIFNMGE